jgi:hypothetical protein
MAFVGIKRCLGRLPAWIPDKSFIVDIIVLAVGIIRDVVIAVACDAEHLRILIEAVAAAGVGNDREEIVASEIIDPWKRRFGGRDDVLTGRIIEITVFHVWSSFLR